MPTNIFKNIKWESVSLIVIYSLVFLLPVFVWPFIGGTFVLSKSLLFYFGISLAGLFWFLSILQTGELKIPKSALFLSLMGIIAVWFISSLFSDIPQLSFLGKGDEIGTFSFFLFLSFAAFLVSTFLYSEKRVFVFYLLTFLSGLIVFLFQFFHIVFKIDIIPLNIFSSNISNLIGGWNDFAIFFGFIGLTALIFFELFTHKKIKTVMLVVVLLSLVAMAVANFFTGWMIFGAFVLVLLVYLYSKSFLTANGEKLENGSHQLLRFSFFILLIVFIFVSFKDVGIGLNNFFNTGFIDVRPSWSATWDVVKKTTEANILLGSGPNTFLYDWFKFKPPLVNNTIFWNTRFLSGIGSLPSMIASTGALGGLALLIFLVLFFSSGFKILSPGQGNGRQVLLVASFFGSAYLWIVNIFYSPGFVISALAFLNTGVLIAMLVQTGKIKNLEISFLKNPRVGFIFVLLIVFLIIGSLFTSYLFLQKGRAAYFYSNAINIFNTEGYLDKTESNLVEAGRLDRQDEYFRALSDLNLVRMQQVISDKSMDPNQARAQFQNALSLAIQSAQESTKINFLEPLNWMQLGKVYEAVVPIGITGAADMALSSYQEALKYSPLDPSPLLAFARTEIQDKKLKEARNYLQDALALKNDFAPAIFLLSQIEVREGNIKEAISKNEQAAFLAPMDVGIMFQLGLLYYQSNNLNNSRLAFERAVSLNENYANARYFLGLIYDRQGDKKKAIEQFENIIKENSDNEEVKRILNNLKQGGTALEGISPPAQSPESRENPPISEKEPNAIKKK